MAIGRKQLQHLFELVGAHKLEPQAALDIALGKAPFPGEPAAAVELKADESAETPTEAVSAESTGMKVQEVKPTVGAKAVALFDQHGRRIPPQGMKATQVVPSGQCYLDQPKLDKENDLAQRLAYFQLAFEFAPELDFLAEFQKLKAAVAAAERIANLLNGVCLPIILPQINRHDFDYGSELDQFINAAKTVYLTQFPGRTLHSTNDIKLNVVDAGHLRLLERLFQGCLVALFFPGALHGFSLQAQREQMADSELPDSIYLAGGLDTMTATAMYPDIIARDSNALMLYLSAVQYDSGGHSLYFEPGKYYISMNKGVYLDKAGSYISGGLVFCPE